MKKTLISNGYPIYFWYIDSTHVYCSNHPDIKGFGHHLYEFKDEPYFEELKDWVKEQVKNHVKHEINQSRMK